MDRHEIESKFYDILVDRLYREVEFRIKNSSAESILLNFSELDDEVYDKFVEVAKLVKDRPTHLVHYDRESKVVFRSNEVCFANASTIRVDEYIDTYSLDIYSQIHAEILVNSNNSEVYYPELLYSKALASAIYPKVESDLNGAYRRRFYDRITDDTKWCKQDSKVPCVDYKISKEELKQELNSELIASYIGLISSIFNNNYCTIFDDGLHFLPVLLQTTIESTGMCIESAFRSNGVYINPIAYIKSRSRASKIMAMYWLRNFISIQDRHNEFISLPTHNIRTIIDNKIDGVKPTSDDIKMLNELLQLLDRQYMDSTPEDNSCNRHIQNVCALIMVAIETILNVEYKRDVEYNLRKYSIKKDTGVKKSPLDDIIKNIGEINRTM